MDGQAAKWVKLNHDLSGSETSLRSGTLGAFVQEGTGDSMCWPTPSVVQHIDSRVPRQLVNSRQVEACLSLMERLPTPIGSYRLQCRLDRDEPSVEFLVMFSDRLGAHAHLSANWPKVHDPRWTRIMDLLGRWSGKEGQINALPSIGLDYLIDDAFHAPRAVPNVSVAMDATYPGGHAWPNRHSEVLARARASIEHLVNQDRLAVVMTLVSRVVKLLPLDGTLTYLSETWRGDRIVTQLSVKVPKDYTMLFLLQLGWSGNLSEVRRALNMSVGEDAVCLDLTIHQGLLKRLGLMLGQIQQQETSQTQALWGYLNEQNVASDKRQALVSWPGISRVLVAQTPTLLDRWVDVKLVLQEDGEPTYWAGLGFAQVVR